MASRSSKGGRPGSPIKKSKTTNNNNNEASVSGMYQEDYYQADVVRGLTEREVEIDHLKTTVFALNEQV